MATVYLARDLRHDRLVAVKVFRGDLAEGEQRVDRPVAAAAQQSARLAQRAGRVGVSPALAPEVAAPARMVG